MDKDLIEYLREHGVDEERLSRIEAAPYPPNADESQAYANQIAARLRACEACVDMDTLYEAMGERACCKSGFRLKNASAIGRADATLEEKLRMLSEAPYMGRGRVTPEGDLLLEAVGVPGDYERSCPCWRLKGHTPENGAMPASYCACCAGHFRFHYEKALGRKLRLKNVVSSILESGGKAPCVFLYAFDDLRGKTVPEALESPQCAFVAPENRAFIAAFDAAMAEMGLPCAEGFTDGICWGKYMLIYRKAKKVVARVYVREDGIALRLFLSDIDKHAAFIEAAPERVREPFTGPRGDCKHCKGDSCRFRKLYTLCGKRFEKCNGETFTYDSPTLAELPDYLSLLGEFYGKKK